jgi:hypothetical protein
VRPPTRGPVNIRTIGVFNRQQVVDHDRLQIIVVLAKYLCDALDLVRIEEIISIQKAKNIAAACRHSRVERRGLSPVQFQDRYDPVPVPLNDLTRPVDGAIVNNQDLGFPVCLTQRAVYSAR